MPASKRTITDVVAFIEGWQDRHTVKSAAVSELLIGLARIASTSRSHAFTATVVAVLDRYRQQHM